MTSRRRLWPHVVALGVVLAALVPLLVRDGLVSADEGAVLSQLEVRETFGGWGMPNPLPSVDPDARWFGISGSDLAGDRAYPYAKHAAYPWAVQPLFDLGGARLVVAASALGTLLTSALAALLARRVRRDLDVPTLWVVGVVSPLFFDSFWATAHSIGAAFATGAVLVAVHAAGRRQVRWLPLLAIAVAGAALFRSEGMLFGIALGGGCLVVAAFERAPVALAAAGVSGGVASLAWWADSRIYTEIVGTARSPFRISSGPEQSWLAGRWDGIWASLLRPQLQAPTAAGTIFLGIALVGALAALFVRFRPGERTLIRGLSVVAGAAALAAPAFRVAPVPGLLVAFPLAPVGILLAGRTAVATTAAKIAAATGVLFAGAVVATQYPVGGSMEWGGRFFHLALPAAVPVLLLSLDAVRSTLDPTTRRVAGGALAAVTVVLLAFSVGSVVRLRHESGDLVRALTTLSATTSSAADPAGPVVVTNFAPLGRFAWADAVHARYLGVAASADLDTVAARLGGDGVDEFVFAAPFRQERDRARLRGYEPVEGGTVVVGEWELTVMRRTNRCSSEVC